MTGGFLRIPSPIGCTGVVLLCLASGQPTPVFAQSIRLAAGSAAAEVAPTNEPRAHLRNLSNAVWSKAMESETPTRAPIRLISRYTRYPFGQYGVHGRYPFGTPYYSYGPSLGERSYGQYPVPRPAPPAAIAAPIPAWAVEAVTFPGIGVTAGMGTATAPTIPSRGRTAVGERLCRRVGVTFRSRPCGDQGRQVGDGTILSAKAKRGRTTERASPPPS